MLKEVIEEQQTCVEYLHLEINILIFTISFFKQEATFTYHQP